MNNAVQDKNDVIAISSRVRLARNFSGYPFPNQAESEQLSEILEKSREVFEQLNHDKDEPWRFISMRDITSLDRHYLKERHMISPEYARKSDDRALIMRVDESIGVMVNEEDHLRIQCFLSGMRLMEAWRIASTIDDTFEEAIDYAFNDEYGYLTSCPTNVGTGMRASVMLHLPALTISGQSNEIFTSIKKHGIAVRGMYGEGSECIGNLFQISNQITLGLSEETIIERLEGFIQQIIDKELETREKMLSEDRDKLEDRIWRSYGVLQYARIMPSHEALKLLSDVRLGYDLGIVKNLSRDLLDRLVQDLGPATIRKFSGMDMPNDKRDLFRAGWIRDRINESANGGGNDAGQIYGQG